MNLEILKERLSKNDNFKKIYYDKNDIAFEVARMIKNFRMKNGLTQAQLAKLVKTKQSSIARLEQGNYSPSLGFLEKIATVLKVKMLPPRFVPIKKYAVVAVKRKVKSLHPCR